MREPTYFLLLSLAQGPLYGYGIAKKAEGLSAGRVKLTAGTLYGALDRLLVAGEIRVDREEVVEGRRRRYFEISDEGRTALALETARMREAVQVADSISLGGGANVTAKVWPV